MIKTLCVRGSFNLIFWLAIITEMVQPMIFSILCSTPIGYFNYYEEICDYLQEKVASVFYYEL